MGKGAALLGAFRRVPPHYWAREQCDQGHSKPPTQLLGKGAVRPGGIPSRPPHYWGREPRDQGHSKRLTLNPWRASRKRRGRRRTVRPSLTAIAIRRPIMTFASATTPSTLSADELAKIDAYWRAANFLSVNQIYLCDNPLMRKPLELSHIKHMLLGHWGTTPGQNFIYAHLNRVIKKNDLSMIYISGPGHGGPAIVGNVYLEGTYSEIYPDITQDEDGLRKLFKQFSFPGGIPSHVSAECPGSIHEGGELGYSLSHAGGAGRGGPDRGAAGGGGGGGAETGPLATAWHSNKFLNAATDGADLPILHLNGYKIANPTILA